MSTLVFSWIAKRGLVSSKQCFGCDGSKLTNDPVAFPHGNRLTQGFNQLQKTWIEPGEGLYLFKGKQLVRSRADACKGKCTLVLGGGRPVHLCDLLQLGCGRRQNHGGPARLAVFSNYAGD